LNRECTDDTLVAGLASRDIPYEVYLSYLHWRKRWEGGDPQIPRFCYDAYDIQDAAREHGFLEEIYIRQRFGMKDPDAEFTSPVFVAGPAPTVEWASTVDDKPRCDTAWQRKGIKADRKVRQVQKAADKRKRVEAFAQRQLEARTRLEKDVERLVGLLQSAQNDASKASVLEWRKDTSVCYSVVNRACTDDALAGDLASRKISYGAYLAFLSWRKEGGDRARFYLFALYDIQDAAREGGAHAAHQAEAAAAREHDILEDIYSRQCRTGL